MDTGTGKGIPRIFSPKTGELIVGLICFVKAEKPIIFMQHDYFIKEIRKAVETLHAS